MGSISCSSRRPRRYAYKHYGLLLIILLYCCTTIYGLMGFSFFVIVQVYSNDLVHNVEHDTAAFTGSTNNHDGHTVEITALDWTYCNGNYGNRTDALFEQLIDIRDVFVELNVKHVVWDGTHIGAMRDHGMNPYEIDNDLLVWWSVPDKMVYQKLYDRGLILFEDGCWRICRKRSSGRRLPIPPWESWWPLTVYFPYTDVYTIDWMKHFARTHLEQFPTLKSILENWDGETVKKHFADTYVFVPGENFTEQWLTARYGDWRKPPIETYKNTVYLGVNKRESGQYNTSDTRENMQQNQ
eukprot:788653_1